MFETHSPNSMKAWIVGYFLEACEFTYEANNGWPPCLINRHTRYHFSVSDRTQFSTNIRKSSVIISRVKKNTLWVLWGIFSYKIIQSFRYKFIRTNVRVPPLAEHVQKLIKFGLASKLKTNIWYFLL